VSSRIRPARPDETGAVTDLLRRTGFGASVGRLLELPQSTPQGTVLVAEGDDGHLAGTASCLALGSTGWIGAVAVDPAVRRRGLGSALGDASARWLHSRGVETVLLYATDAGRPVYARLGFVEEGSATAWRGTAGARAAPPVRRLAEADRPELARVDGEATGEDRGLVLGAIAPLRGLACETGGQVAGFAIASQWGAGTAIAARDPDAGLALMAGVAGGSAPTTLIVPDENPAAVKAVRHWSFVRYNTAQRMRLGPPVDYAPERVFGMFNLFWG